MLGFKAGFRASVFEAWALGFGGFRRVLYLGSLK